METPPLETQPGKKLTRTVWIALLLLGFSGQLAWAVENQFFNTFLYNEITPDPQAISWMVAITAFVSTTTAILMGNLSDRTRSKWGRRRPYLVIGYVIWGIFTGLFSSSALFSSVSAGVFMAILLDSIMTFFGATANDAAFNAYVTDVTNKENRGRVSGILEIMTWISILFVYGGSGLIIEAVGYPVFFYAVGGIVLLVGLITAPMLKEPPVTEPVRGTYWQQLARTFSKENLKVNRDVFLILASSAIFNLATNVFFPYLVVYLQHHLKLPTLQYSILVGVAILVGAIILAYPIGLLVDKWGRFPVAVLAIVLEAVGLFVFSLTKNFIPALFGGLLWLTPMAAYTIAILAWTKDLFPEENRGQFAGYYVLFKVAFAMIPGPLLGGWLAAKYGQAIVIDGNAGTVPPPLIFQVAAGITLLALIPLFFMRRKQKNEARQLAEEQASQI